MALQNISGLWIPHPMGQPAVDGSTLLVDASGEKAAFLFRIIKTGTLRKVGFRTGTVVQNQTIRVSFQDVSATTGDPDETQDQFRDISIADTDDNVWKTTGLITSDGTDGGVKRSVTRGDLLAIVWESNPFNAGDVFRLAAISVTPPLGFMSGVYGDLKAGAGPAWVKQSLYGAIALLYDDGAGNDTVYFTEELYPWLSAASVNYNSGSSPNKKGLKFRLPFPFKTLGAYVNLTASTANGTYVVKLYDSDGSTVLQTSATVDTDQVRNSSQTSATVYWPTDQQLLANTYYYISLEPTAAVNIALSTVTVNTASYMDQTEGGQDFHYFANTGGGGSFVADTTQRPIISVLISAIDDGVQLGGLITNPGMTGGMRG
jgi:hypothetical protein